MGFKELHGGASCDMKQYVCVCSRGNVSRRIFGNGCVGSGCSCDVVMQYRESKCRDKRNTDRRGDVEPRPCGNKSRTQSDGDGPVENDDR